MLKWLLFFPRNTGWFQSFIWKKMTIFIPKSKISRFFGINFGICASENIVFNFLEKTLKATILKMMILIALILVQVFLHLSNRRFKFFSFMPKLMTHFYDWFLWLIFITYFYDWFLWTYVLRVLRLMQVSLEIHFVCSWYIDDILFNGWIFMQQMSGINSMQQILLQLNHHFPSPTKKLCLTWIFICMVRSINATDVSVGIPL